MSEPKMVRMSQSTLVAVVTAIVGGGIGYSGSSLASTSHRADDDANRVTLGEVVRRLERLDSKIDDVAGISKQLARLEVQVEAIKAAQVATSEQVRQLQEKKP